MSRFRIVAALLSLFMFVSIFGTGCGSSKNSEKDSSTKSEISASTAEVSKSEEVKPPVKLKMFMGDAGISVPKEIDPGNNPFIEIVEKKANVDLEIVKPDIADFQTKFNLLMSSGDLPDIIHCWFPEEVKKYGTSGAFIPLNDYIKNSPVFSNFFLPEVLEAQKAEDGNIYGFVAQDSGDNNATIARIDLINELNGGVAPTNPDEWYAFFMKVKSKYPDSVPYSSQGQLAAMDVFFRAFGIEFDSIGPLGIGWQVSGGKVVSILEAPGMKAAVEYHKKLYTDKIIDQQFVANKGSDWVNRIMEKDMCVWNSSTASFQWVMNEWLKKGETKKSLGFVPQPVAPGVDEKDAYYKVPPMGFHSLSISAKCKDIDAAVKTCEAFASPEIKTAATWGREGFEYSLKDGVKALNLAESDKTPWRLIYGFMWQYGYDPDFNNAKVILQMNDAQRKVYLNSWDSGLKIREKQNSIAGIQFLSLMKQNSVVTDRKAEAEALAQSIICKAIVGTITMEQFDSEVSKFVKKYENVKQEYQKWYDSWKK